MWCITPTTKSQASAPSTVLAAALRVVLAPRGSDTGFRDPVLFPHQFLYLELERDRMSSVARCKRLFLFDIPLYQHVADRSDLRQPVRGKLHFPFHIVSCQAEARGPSIRETGLPVMPFKPFELGNHAVAD